VRGSERDASFDGLGDGFKWGWDWRCGPQRPAAGLILARLTQLLPYGGERKGLEGEYLIPALIGNFVFGALMTIGAGAYAPIMIMVSLLGMNPETAFYIMIGWVSIPDARRQHPDHSCRNL
jgi:hypothetical protein